MRGTFQKITSKISKINKHVIKETEIFSKLYAFFLISATLRIICDFIFFMEIKRSFAYLDDNNEIY